MLGRMPVGHKPPGKSGRKLRVYKETHQAMQHRMIALSRRVFERGGNVSGFEQGVILENFLAAGAGSQEVEHVFDADAQASEAGTPAA
jgi:hypothetical protein